MNLQGTDKLALFTLGIGAIIKVFDGLAVSVNEWLPGGHGIAVAGFLSTIAYICVAVGIGIYIFRNPSAPAGSNKAFILEGQAPVTKDKNGIVGQSNERLDSTIPTQTIALSVQPVPQTKGQ